ncbi:MAG: deoxyribonuclease IV [Candidatus Paceibacterota bacterium]
MEKTKSKLLLGAHLSIEGGYETALKKISDIGGNCLQIFSASPRGWNFPKVTPEKIEEFKKFKKDLKIDPVYFHASYLINLADYDRIGDLSENLLTTELKVASELGVRGSIIHLGSFKDSKTTFEDPKSDADIKKYDVLIDRIKNILNKTPKNTLFIIENSGVRKIALRLEEISYIMKRINNDRVKVCLDTCHLHAAGYDLTSEEKFSLFLKNFDKLIGLSNLELFHLNDSRDPLESFRDRHDNIGEGSIGFSVFELILNNSKTKNLPFIIETPGFDDNGPDKKNLDILKSLVK